MNYLSEILQFNDRLMYNRLSTGQIALWHALMYINNKCAWAEEFTVSNHVLENLTGLSRQAILKDRNVLAQKGLLQFKVNGKKATVYKMLSLTNNCQDSCQSGCQDSCQSGCQDSSALNKQKQKLKTKQNEKANAFSSEAEAAVIVMPMTGGKEYGVSSEAVKKWRELYPAVDIMQELRNMVGWLDANPTRKKTRAGMPRFINGWLSKEQNKGGVKRNAGYSYKNGGAARNTDYGGNAGRDGDELLIGMG